MNTTPGPVDVVNTIAQSGAQNLLQVVGSVLPILIPVFAAFWGIRYALGKLGITQR
jgi:hypothetical protein